MNVGVVSLTDEQSDFFDDESDENRVTLLVQNVVPPFLDGRFVFTKQSKPIVPVKDATSDLAVVATKGSKVNRLLAIEFESDDTFFLLVYVAYMSFKLIFTLFIRNSGQVDFFVLFGYIL